MTDDGDRWGDPDDDDEPDEGVPTADVDPETFDWFRVWTNNPVSENAKARVPDDLRRQILDIPEGEPERSWLRETLSKYEQGHISPREFAQRVYQSQSVNYFPHDKVPTELRQTVTVDHVVINRSGKLLVLLTIPHDKETYKHAYEQDDIFRAVTEVVQRQEGYGHPDDVHENKKGRMVAIEKSLIGVMNPKRITRYKNPSKYTAQTEADDIHANVPPRRSTEADKEPYPERTEDDDAQTDNNQRRLLLRMLTYATIGLLIGSTTTYTLLTP